MPLSTMFWVHAVQTTDEEILCAGEEEKLRLCMISDPTRLGLLVYNFLDKTRTDFYLKTLDSNGALKRVFAGADYSFGPRFISGKILAITDRDAPNFRIVELRSRGYEDIEWIDIVPESDRRIHQWIVAGDRILVSYIRQGTTSVSVFDLEGNKTDEWPVRTGGRTVRFIAASPDSDEVMIETESFTRPPAMLLCAARSNRFELWSTEKDSLLLRHLRPQAGLLHIQGRDSNSDIPGGPPRCAQGRMPSGDHDFLRRLRRFDDAAVQRVCRFSHRAEMPVCVAQYPRGIGVWGRMAQRGQTAQPADLIR